MFNIQYGNRHKGMKRGLIQWWNTKWRILQIRKVLSKRDYLWIEGRQIQILNLRIPAELGQNDFKKLMTLINHWNCNEIKWRNIKWRILQLQKNVKRLLMKGRVKNSYFDLRIPAELGQNGFKMELEAFDFGKPLKLKWIKSNSGSSNFIFQNHTRVFFKSIPDHF